MTTATMMKRVGLTFLLVVAITSLAVGFWSAILREGGSQDMEWDPSRTLLEHNDPYAQYLDGAGMPGVFLAQAPTYPASSLVMLWPYAIWPWSIAKVLWMSSNFIFTGVILYSLFRLLPSNTPTSTKLLLTSLFLIGTPWRVAVGNGQHSLFSLSMFLLAIVIYSRSSKGAIPLLLSWFKYTITFPLSLFFARTRRGRALITIALSTHLALVGFLAMWADASLLRLLIGHIQVAETATGVGNLDVFAIATTVGLSSKLLPGLAGLLILGITYAAVMNDTDNLSSLSTLSLAAMTVVFHLNYDFVILVIPLTYALRERGANARARYYLLLVGIIWLLDKVVFVLSPSSAVTGLLIYYFWIKVCLFYGALVVDWLIGFRRQQSSMRHIAAMSRANRA